MATQALADVLRYIHCLADDRFVDASDGKLLEQFISQRDELAFAAILQRHGPLVFGVCRQVLGNPHDAEDAFQATFLVLARKATCIRKQEALAAWLHRVALNIARTAKSSTVQRRVHERQAVPMSETNPVDEVALRDWQPLIHEEVDRLPEKYRVGVVLCYLEGKTHEEAARQLGWPVGTVKGRLARARDLLRARLARRGLALSATGFAAAFTQKGASGAVPATLLGHTLRAAVSFAGSGSIPAGAISAQALALATTALQTMTTTKLLHLFVLMLAIGVITLPAVLGAGGQGETQNNGVAESKPSPMNRKETVPPALIQKDRAKGVQVTLASTQKEYRPGEPVNLVLTITNHSKEEFSYFQYKLQDLYYFVVIGPDGKEVERKPNPVEISFASTLVKVPPGEKVAIKEGLQGINLPKAGTNSYLRHGYYPIDAPGTYRLRIRVGDATSNELHIKILGNEAAQLQEADLRKLDGAWRLAALEQGGRAVGPDNFGRNTQWVFSGTTGTFKSGLRVLDCKLKIDPSKSPKWIDLTNDRGVLVLQGIYELNGDTLKLFLEPPQGKRPRAFKSNEHTEQRIHTYERVKPGRNPQEQEGGDDPQEVRALAPFRPGGKEAEPPADPLLLGALARMGSVRFRHGGRVSSLAYLAKGKLLASGGYVGTTWDAHGRVRVWDTASGEELRHYRLQGLAQVAASPDGTILAGASAGDGTVYLWDVASGQEIRRLKGSPGFDGRFCGLAFSPDGKVLALGGHALHVWQVETGKLVHYEKDEDHPLLQLAFSGDGKILAMTRVDDTSLQLLDAESWKKRKPFLSQRGIIAFALPDHKTLVALKRATAEENSSSVGLVDLATGKQLRQFDANGGAVHSLALSPDSKMLATFSSDKAIHIWEVATGKRRQELPADKYAHGTLAFAPDQQRLAWANSAGQIRIWSLATGKTLHSTVGHEGVVSSVALSADGKTLFSAGTDRTIRIWDARTGKELRSFGAHLGPVAAIALSPNGKILASVSTADGRVRQWQLPRPREMKSFPASTTYCEIAWLPDSATLAVRRIDDQAVTFYDAAGGKIIRKIESTLPPNVIVYPDRHTEAAYTGGFLIVSPDGKTLATCCNFCRPSFQLWEAATGKKLRHRAVEDPDQAAVMSAVFSPDSKTVFTATYRTIRLWDIARGKQLQQFIAHEAKITCLAISPDGKTLAVVGSDPTIRLWDVATRKERRRLEGHEGQVTSLSWSADSQTLASGSADGTALVWDLRR
ncbi:MAG TPA: sigma-70 family RNA polymerase sigma factor [Gemmataceae bacterium]|nr:sigma-70 family RNA polymerase sigma factor [Gemmataceae bacterium]